MTVRMSTAGESTSVNDNCCAAVCRRRHPHPKRRFRSILSSFYSWYKMPVMVVVVLVIDGMHTYQHGSGEGVSGSARRHQPVPWQKASACWILLCQMRPRSFVFTWFRCDGGGGGGRISHPDLCAMNRTQAEISASRWEAMDYQNYDHLHNSNSNNWGMADTGHGATRCWAIMYARPCTPSCGYDLLLLPMGDTGQAGRIT